MADDVQVDSADVVPDPSSEMGVVLQRIEALREHVNETRQMLEKIALDEERSNEDRREAFFLLGKLGDDESITFLAKHISVQIPMFAAVTDDDRQKEWPAYYALINFTGWNCLPAALRQLREERSRQDLLLTEHLLRGRLGTAAASAVLQAEAAAATEELHRENLKKVLEVRPD
jgi:hypothetical protein